MANTQRVVPGSFREGEFVVCTHKGTGPKYFGVVYVDIEGIPLPGGAYTHGKLHVRDYSLQSEGALCTDEQGKKYKGWRSDPSNVQRDLLRNLTGAESYPADQPIIKPPAVEKHIMGLSPEEIDKDAYTAFMRDLQT